LVPCGCIPPTVLTSSCIGPTHPRGGPFYRRGISAVPVSDKPIPSVL
jgi:hypothetical protein